MGVDSASKWIEYQGYLLGTGEIKAADACSWQLNHIHVPTAQKFWKTQLPEALTACPGLWRIAWTLLVWHTGLMFIDKILLASCQFLTFHNFTTAWVRSLNKYMVLLKQTWDVISGHGNTLKDQGSTIPVCSTVPTCKMSNLEKVTVKYINYNFCPWGLCECDMQ